MKTMQVQLTDIDMFHINEIRKFAGDKYGFSIIGVIRSALEELYYKEIKFSALACNYDVKHLKE